MGAALATTSADRCPDCAAPTAELTWIEAALFRHGGYGADRATTIRHCAHFCGWWITRNVIETRPMSFAA